MTELMLTSPEQVPKEHKRNVLYQTNDTSEEWNLAYFGRVQIMAALLLCMHMLGDSGSAATCWNPFPAKHTKASAPWLADVKPTGILGPRAEFSPYGKRA